MSSVIPRSAGLQSMLKEGSKLFSGVDDVLYRSIEACVLLAKLTSTGYGPYGLSKFVINHLDKLQVTSEAATILTEAEVAHPAARILTLACQQMEKEIGDGTNFVLLFAASLLQRARPNLLKMGVRPAQILSGFNVAFEKSLELLEAMVVKKVEDLSKVEEIAQVLNSIIATKQQYGSVEFLSRLVSEACVDASDARIHGNKVSLVSIDVDNVRVVKILGGSVDTSFLIRGIVLKSGTEGSVRSLRGDESLKVAIYSCPIDIAVLETKGTVLMTNADQLLKFSKGEESLLFTQLKALADRGIRVLVAGSKFSEMAIHFCNKLGLMAIYTASKFELRRIARLTRAFVHPSLVEPKESEIGHCSAVYEKEIGRSTVTIIETSSVKKCREIVTIVLRGSTNEILDDAERACNSAVNGYKVLTKDTRLLAGAGAVEIALVSELAKVSENISGGLDRYIVQCFGEAFEFLPRALADNAGFNGTEILAQLYHAHQQNGIKDAGIEFREGSSDKPRIVSVNEMQPWPVYDLFHVKEWAIKNAFHAVSTVLCVDQLLVAKPAGGPKPKGANPGWDED